MIAIVAYAALGFVCAIVFRSVAAAVAIPLAYILVVENLIGGVWTDAQDWLFGKLISGVLNGESLLKSDVAVASYGRGLALGLIYVGIFLVAAAVVFRYRDVTS